MKDSEGRTPIRQGAFSTAGNGDEVIDLFLKSREKVDLFSAYFVGKNDYVHEQVRKSPGSPESAGSVEELLFAAVVKRDWVLVEMLVERGD